MPRTGGNYTLPEPPFVPNTVISSAAMNSDLSDIAAALTGSLARDGQGGMQATLLLAPGGFVYGVDPNTGMRRTAADTQALFAGGTDVFEVTPTGVTALLDFAVDGDFSAADVSFDTVTVTNTLDVAGNSTLEDVTASGVVNMTATSYFKPPVGTTAQRPGTPANGYFRINSDTGFAEYYDGTAWNPLSFAQPNAGSFKNLRVTNNATTPNTQIDFSADEVVVQTSAGKTYRVANISLTNNMAVNGAGGLDASSIASATWYYGYIIYNPSTGTASTLTSTSPTAPTLPSGYTAFARVSAHRTASGSAQLFGTIQIGRRVQYRLNFAQTGTSYPSMASLSNVTPTLTAIAISNFVPTTAGSIQGFLSMTANSGVQLVYAVAPGNAGPIGTGTPVYGQLTNGGSSFTFNAPFNFGIESTNIYYTLGNATGGSAYCTGWEDNI